MLVALRQDLILRLVLNLIVVLIEVADLRIVVLMILILLDWYLLLRRHRCLFLELFTIALKFNRHIYLLIRTSGGLSLLALKIKSLHLQCLLAALWINAYHILQKMRRLLLLMITVRTSLSLLSALDRLQANLCQIFTLRSRSFIIMLGNRPIWVIYQLHMVIIRIVTNRSIGANLLLGELWLRRFPMMSLLNLPLFHGLLGLVCVALISLIILADYLALIMVVTLVMVASRILNNWLTLVVEIDLFNTCIIQNFLVFARILLILNLNMIIQEIIIILLFEFFSV